MTSSNTSALVTGRHLKHRDATGISNIGFITHTVPIVHHNSRIIGVCGVLREDSDPAADGWFLSDFFAMNYLMKGLGASQTWIATSSAEDLVVNYGEFLHGNPYRNRKVVLDEALLQRGEITPVTVAAEFSLHKVTMDVLKKEYEIARLTGAPVLLLLFGHGDDRTYGVELGEDSILRIDDVRSVVGDDIGLTIISTACFSGGWSASTSLNATAAGPMSVSESWNESPSVRRRNCGSIYASALINALSDASSPLIESLNENSSITGSIQPQAPTATQTESFNEFARSIYDTLLDLDRFGDKHDIRFSAQDDDWGASWTGRTGIPLRTFADRWDQLETKVSTAEPGSQLDRSTRFTGSGTSADTSLSLQEFRSLSPGRLGSHDLGGLFGGNPISQKMHVKRMAKALLKTCPGSWTGGYGPKNRADLRRFIESPASDFGNTADILRILKYRFDMLHYADVLIAKLGIQKPDSKYCFQFNWGDWYIRALHTRGDTVKLLCEKSFGRLLDSAMFQPPTKDHGKGFRNPHYYVTAAIVDASETPDDAEAYLDSVLNMNNQHMRADLDYVLRICQSERHQLAKDDRTESAGTISKEALVFAC